MKSNITFSYMRLAIELANDNVRNGRAPFAALIVLNNKVIGQGKSMVKVHLDPTSHAEINAIRNACSNIGHYRLFGSTIYSSAEPCPMCLCAIFWAGIEKIYYGNSISDSDEIGYRDKIFYEQLKLSQSQRIIPSIQILRDEAFQTFNKWREKKSLFVK